MSGLASERTSPESPTGYDGDDPRGVTELVKACVPHFRATAMAAERARDPLDDNIRLLEQAGVYRLSLARHRGGMEAGLDERFDVLHEIGRGDPSLAWVTGIHLDGIWLAASYRDEAQDEIFAKPDVRLCGVLAPTGRGTVVDGGLLVSGRWAFNTGWHHADWVSLAVLVEDEAGGTVLHTALVPRADTRSLGDWDPMGMGGTGSHSTVVDRLFVPAHRVMRRDRRDHGFSVMNGGNPYFRIPTVQYIAAAVTGSIVGMARGTMEAFLERLPGREITYTDYPDQSEAAVTHLQVGRAELEIQAAEMFGRKANQLVTRYMGKEMPLETRAQVRACVGQLTEHSRRAVRLLFEASGASVIQSSVALQRYLRDTMAVCQHALLSPASTQELYGRVLVGKAPNTRYL